MDVLTRFLKGVGQDNKLVVAAAAIIDTEGLVTSEDFGVQKKNPFVQKEVMSSLMKVSYCCDLRS